jgi:hypothetical protein
VRDRSSVLASVAVILLLPACGLFRKSLGGSSASASASSRPPEAAASAAVAPLDPPSWKPLSDPSFIGLPQGCSLGRVLQRAALPAGTVRFSAPASGSDLVVAIDADGNDAVERAGVLDAEGRPSATFPWTKLSEPPAIIRSPVGFAAVRTTETQRGLRTAELWMPPGRSRPLVEGDHLEVADASCAGSRCAVLTNFAAHSASSGATLMTGDPAGSSPWKRVDFPGGDDEWTPFSIVQIDDASVFVALSGHDKIGVWQVADGRAAQAATIDTPIGAYDVVLGEAPIVIAPGESTEAECAKDGFTVKLLGPNGKAHEIDGQVPPETVVTRRLDGGFVVGWLSPTRCRTRSGQTARAFLLGRDGVPKTSTMAMTEADGFAISTHGSELDLWLARRGELVWAKATCHVPEPPAK